MKISDIEWGDDSAERDQQLLEYFVTSDALGRLSRKTKMLVVGRKGAGKSALLAKLKQIFSAQEQTYVVTIHPSYNAITNILNDDKIKSDFGSEIFFQHSWMRKLYLDSLGVVGKAQVGFSLSEAHAYARRIATLQGQVAKDLVENIGEIVGRLKIKAGSLGELGISLEKTLKDASNIYELERHMEGILDDGSKIVILIDDLDLGWDNSPTANNFLLGLLSAINRLSSQHKNIHAITFLREDIYNLILEKTQHADKYRNIERIRWDKDKLVRVLNARINYNRSRQRLPDLGEVAFYAVFPTTIGAAYADNWLFERTLSRPRELIQFARNYTESVEDNLPSADRLKDAETEYSNWKLADICSEYRNQYPEMARVTSYWASKFRRKKYHLKRSELDEMIRQVFVDVKIEHPWYRDIQAQGDIGRFLDILFEIGLIGDFVLGGSGGSKTYYSYEERHEPRFEEVQIHPCFRRALNTVERIRE